MEINKDTKISALISENMATIDAIASINKHFKKLNNPILRKLLARRVSIEDAAKVGGVSIQKIYDILTPLGFHVVNSNNTTHKAIVNEKHINEIIMDNISINEKLSTHPNISVLDVRPILDGGEDPFKTIMARLKIIKQDEVLRIINTFEPIPLINIIKKKGYLVEVERPSAGVVETYILKKKEVVPSQTLSEENNTSTKALDQLSFDKIKAYYKDKTTTLDVRALEMPEPMVQILTSLESLSQDHILYVKHKKFPKYLVPELKTRGYKLVDKRIDEHNIELLILRQEK